MESKAVQICLGFWLQRTTSVWANIFLRVLLLLFTVHDLKKKKKKKQQGKLKNKFHRFKWQTVVRANVLSLPTLACPPSDSYTLGETKPP